MASTAIYVYCVVRSTRKPATARVPAGLPGAESPQVTKLDGTLWLVHAVVPLARYGSAPLEVSLRDLQWVSTIAVAHEAVVEHFAEGRGATVIPMKLFTMFTTLDRAMQEMQLRRDDLEDVLERIAGCEEWGVRVMRGAVKRAERRSARPESGAEFLAARKRARDDAYEAARGAAEAADEAFARLSRIAKERRRRSDDTPGAAPPLLDAAFLVPAARRARFHATAERVAQDLARRGAQMTLTGPWPPYNFVTADTAKERA
jgi:Gas vesicle synthesis protein GvpL/GvpF